MSKVRDIALKVAENITDESKRNAVLHSISGDASCYDQVKAFHLLYDAPIATKAVDRVPHMSDERLKLRVDLIEEEFTELKDAIAERDIVEMADACADLCYVICGLAIEAGIDLKAVFDEVQASNMTKLDENGQVVRREDGKILKGNLFTKPDIKSVLFSS